MGNKYLIINADDFGRAKSVNESIFNLLKENRISSATLMPNVNYYEQAVNRWDGLGMVSLMLEVE